MHRRVVVTDPLQKGFSYDISESEGKNLAPDFKPEVSPKEMLALGVFGGDYFEGHIEEYPLSWFTHAKLSPPGTYNASLNFFGVRASQSREVWIANGWMHPDDPRGWFQWYCRYYAGRRKPLEDRRQIERWQKIVRHLAQIRYACRAGDHTCRPRQRQAVLHWAYNATIL